MLKDGRFKFVGRVRLIYGELPFKKKFYSRIFLTDSFNGDIIGDVEYVEKLRKKL
jgi:hypothetical protein